MSEFLTEKEIVELKSLCTQIRKDIVEMIYTAKSGHPGGNLSAVEILTVLYKKIMKHSPLWDKSPDFDKRDRFVLSKGHASAALYSTLAHCGYFDPKDLPTFRKLGSKLQGHPSNILLKGIEVSTGSLGQGLSIACGMAMGLKLDKNPASVYVLLGDGELQEGSVWEAMMNASHRNLDNLVAIVDRNRLQIDSDTETIKSMDCLFDKFEAFNWATIEVDGHNIQDLYEAFEVAKTMNRPTAIIANTIKGKGVSFMENTCKWHGKAPSKEDYEAALKELEQSC